MAELYTISAIQINEITSLRYLTKKTRHKKAFTTYGTSFELVGIRVLKCAIKGDNFVFRHGNFNRWLANPKVSPMGNSRRFVYTLEIFLSKEEIAVSLV